MQKGVNENENSIHMNANSIINQKMNMNANAIAIAIAKAASFLHIQIVADRFFFLLLCMFHSSHNSYVVRRFVDADAVVRPVVANFFWCFIWR